MTPDEWKVLHGFAAMLEQQPRIGAPVDQPEGSRVIKITLSDTFTERLSMALRQVSGQLEEQHTALEALRHQVDMLTEPQIILPGGKK